MVRKILFTIAILVLALLAVLLFNTFRNKPWPDQQPDPVLYSLPDSALKHLSEAVQIQTVSFSDSSSIDTASFNAFGKFISRAYPHIEQKLERTTLRTFSYVFEWKGTDTTKPPVILMGHYDVVPVEQNALSLWKVLPFSGKITDSCVWGRGSVDDKSGVISILEAVESMLAEGFVPERSIFLCFGHDEEISGRGAASIADYLEKRNVRPEMVLDEGGEVTEEKIKDVPRPIAAIGVSEKGYASFELRVQKEGGHSSKPERETSIDILAAALYRLRSESLPARITPPVKEFLKRIGSSSHNFPNRLASANMWLFEGKVKKLLSAAPEGNAMIHTTFVPTILSSGTKDNLIPSIATAIINCRILPGENAATVENDIRNMIDDKRVSIRKVGQFNSDPSPATEVTSPAFKRIESAVYKTIPHVIPAPYLMIGATDSRHYRRISNGVVNFLPMTDSKGYHGINERLPVKSFQRSIHFMRTIIRESSQDF
ncbi:MAG: M20/M25/M40 family metallo-hydrolase [Flavisolibacter sp.]